MKFIVSHSYFLLMSKQVLTKYLKVFVLFLLVFSLPGLTATAITLEDIERLDIRLKKLSFDIHKSLAKKSQTTADINIGQLHNKVKQSIQENDAFSAISLIHIHFDIIKNNINNQLVFEFVNLLLKYNEYNMASLIYKEVKENSNAFFITNVTLEFAKYHSDRNEWKKVLQLLNIDLGQLSEKHTNHAYILKAMAFQHIKEHRTAITFYEKVVASSEYYPIAQLNIAIAYIRQGWWTDAHIIINKLLNKTKNIQQDEFKNRLRLILGYSLLSKEFFRESRESFRDVSLDSQYANKALMGIALTAINQGDNIGALNVLSALKEKKSFELVAEETYLILPGIYKRLEQYITANASYMDAVSYYEKRIKQLSIMREKDHTYSLDNVTINEKSILILKKNQLEFTKLYPQYFIDNFIRLKSFKQKTDNSYLNKETNKLYNKYVEAFDQMVKELLNKRIKSLESYLNQSRFGLAQLYDRSNTK